MAKGGRENWDTPLEVEPGKAQPVPPIDRGGCPTNEQPRNTLGLPIVDERNPAYKGPKI